MNNFIFDIKEGWKMFRGFYRIKTLDYSKILIKYGEILTRRRYRVEPEKFKKLMKTILEYNRLIEEVNY